MSYSFMFPRTLDGDTPCWSSSSILDSLDAAARHLAHEAHEHWEPSRKCA